MVKTKEILAYLDELAPMHMKMDFDNVGLLVGRGEREVTGVLVSLDVTKQVIAEAKELGANLIVAHHPLLLSPIKAVTDGNLVGEKLLELIEHNIGAICMHTNLDSVAGGVNDALAEAIGLKDTCILWEQGEDNGKAYGLGRVGYLEKPLTMEEFLPKVKQGVQTAGIRYESAGRMVHKVAVMGGSGSDILPFAKKADCDTFLVGEVKYHTFLEAKEYGINLVEADHFCTENVVSEGLAEKIAKQFPQVAVTVSKVQGQAFDFFV